MPPRLPPLHDLVAFEAAAQLMSFLKAGGELHVTQSAVSHRIKALEEFRRALACGDIVYRAAALAGERPSVKRKIAPARGADAARMRPPWRSTIR